MMVGNKLDLCTEDPSKRQVTTTEGEKLAESQNVMFEETSAVRGNNVRNAFESLMQSIIKMTIGIYDTTIGSEKKQSVGERLGTVSSTDSKSCAC